MIRLSFIVPFYGVEQYIEQCLFSLLNQDVSQDEYEIICINDCSPDNSEKIVKEIAINHSNVRLINHEENKKLGAARNTGILSARGQYVWFVDSDDYIKENCLQEIIEVCEANDLDILHFNICDNKGNVFRRLEATGVISGIEEEKISYKQQSVEITYPWNRVYKKDFLLTNNLYFNDLYGGDVIHTILAIDCCKRIKNVDEFYYYYRVDNINSDTHSSPTAEKIYKMYCVLSKGIEEITLDLNQEWRCLIEECVYWRVNQLQKAILKLRREEIKEFYRLVRGDMEISDFISKYAYKRTLFLLKHRNMTICASLIYKFLRSIKKNLNT